MKTVLIDTNIFLLLIIGTYDPDFVERHKRTRQYRKENFFQLDQLLFGSDLVLLPNILTEVSNLIGRAPSDQRSEDLHAIFKFYV